MSIKDLTNRWALPDRSGERTQITLRLDFNEYARLHALKDVYPNRSVNDFLNDIIRAGLDEIVDSLPSRRISQEEAFQLAGYGGYPGDPQDLVGELTGLRVTFDIAYRRILEERAPEETNKEQAA